MGKAARPPGCNVQRLDCREGMAKLRANSISLVLTDPPYFTDGMDDKWDDARLRRRACHKGAVGGLPAGMKFDRKQGRQLQEFLTPIAREWLRLLKPGGFVLCFSQSRLMHRTATALEDAGFEIRDVLAWRYEGQAKAFTQDHFVRRRRDLSSRERERIIAALGGRKTPQLKPQMELIVLGQAPRRGTFVENWLRHRTGLIDVSSPLVEPESFPGTVIPVAKLRRAKERFGHMTAKPVPLLRHLIRIFSDANPRAIVLDPFAGSGSAGEAALLEGRGFLGFEINPTHARRANARLKEVSARYARRCPALSNQFAAID